MRTKLMRIAKVVCFCVIALGIMAFLTKLFTPKWLENRWHSAKTNNSFYELEDNSLDVAIIGSSVVAAAIDPYQLYEEQGISAYNMGVMQQPMVGTYFWLKEIQTTQKPKVVVVEVKTAGRVSDKNEADSRKSYDYMQWGKAKLQYAIEYCNTNEDAELFEYLFPFGKYHTRWSEISEEDYDFVSGNDDSLTRGFVTLTTKSRVEFDGIKTDTDKEAEYNATNADYLKRIIEECQNNDMGVVLVKTPDSSWKASKYNHVKEIAEEYKVDYIDFNAKDMMNRLNIDYAKDSADSVHLNIDGAKKITEYMGKYLKEKYELSDYRTKEGSIKDELDKGLKTYKYAYEDAKLCMENNVDAYLEKLKEGNYGIVVAGGSVFNGKFTDSQKALMAEIGFPQEFFEDIAGENNNIGIIQKDNYEFSSNSNYDEENEIYTSLSKDGYFADGMFYSIVSKRGGAKIKIGTKVHTANASKLNLAVYNPKTREVADCIYFNTDDSGNISIARK